MITMQFVLFLYFFVLVLHQVSRILRDKMAFLNTKYDPIFDLVSYFTFLGLGVNVLK